MKPKPTESAPRPRQEIDFELEGRLLRTVRGQFCGDLPDKEWFQHMAFIRRNVVLWSAAFVTGRGFTMPPARFEAIMMSVFSEIKKNGKTGEIRYWPGYLMKCVQDHWEHHWEEYYKEAKSVRSMAETALVNCGKVAQVDKTIETLALAHQVLTRRDRKRKIAPLAKQADLFRA